MRDFDSPVSGSSAAYCAFQPQISSTKDTKPGYLYRRKQHTSITKTNILMLHNKINAVFCENDIKYGKKQTFLMLKQMTHIYTSVLEGVNVLSKVLNSI
jgi:hypothetical protein